MKAAPIFNINIKKEGKANDEVNWGTHNADNCYNTKLGAY